MTTTRRAATPPLSTTPREPSALAPWRFLRCLLDLLVPACCAGCGVAGVSWCPDCHGAFGRPHPVHRPPLVRGPEAYAVGAYEGVARSAVLAYKERGRRDLADPLGAALAAALPLLPRAGPARDGVWWLVPVPSRGAAARRRGGDHVRRLATRCAAHLALSGRPAVVASGLRLARGVVDAVGLDAAGRVANLAGRVRPRPGGLPPPGTPVVLLDDVITTGATAAAGVAALRSVGVPVAAVLALVSAGGPGRRGRGGCDAAGGARSLPSGGRGVGRRGDTRGSLR
ncbi:putative amidophosphoribosyltransferases [Streptoalloteichus tenebrarius]|uniref:Amidophosphoribosyltransferases n=1 Tax=Streptoalloteichus tenebrarius (strain ATCC 17920 / DSM 40477 / JCM 4838 / CBS 697.72 / NBRC 16177 / NCIMB 11028 / NRRL B-12390 / A12253. 1 / ISP 5477) TaxID=1933 RepID=A0ABT1HT58_STRSD|nr:ComF family protein [Streptoalloteichus tenebrarius]MCP2258687.1 putative amidophosphoribosyltransferases [Streptoalloteichus tenebrarius]BFF02832.1 hypothetical protein GCM10020241_45070 [Streptoalloteichus tenebrarius]